MSNLSHVYAKKVKPAVVAIGLPAIPEKRSEFIIAGTGFCVDPSGIVVTCRHVFEGLQELAPGFADRIKEIMGKPDIVHRISPFVEITCMFYFEMKGRWYLAACVVSDIQFIVETDDIAVLRIGSPRLPPLNIPYPSVRLGNSNDLREGQEVAVCGFPFGYVLQKEAGSSNSSLSAGIVSAILPAPFVISTPENFRSFQLDITTNRGNSGGPAFRQDNGEVMGIVSGGIELEGGHPAGINFAIPINRAKPFLADFVKQADTLRAKAGLSPRPPVKPDGRD